MQSLTAAAISTRNLIGEPEAAIQNMESWLQRAAEQGVELALFPELNVSGYIPAPVAGERPPGKLEPHGRKFPGWAGTINPWGSILGFVDEDGNPGRQELMSSAPKNVCEG